MNTVGVSTRLPDCSNITDPKYCPLPILLGESDSPNSATSCAPNTVSDETWAVRNLRGAERRRAWHSSYLFWPAVERWGEAVASSSLQTAADQLIKRLDELLRIGEEQAFEEGINDPFTQELEWLVGHYASQVLQPLAQRLAAESIDPVVAAHIFRLLGRIDASATRAERRQILVQGLFSRSARVRDGAALGLATLDDPAAIPYLRTAVDRERVAEVRADLEQVRERLERE